MYPSIRASVNGKPYAAIVVAKDTYVSWTAWRDLKCNLTKVLYGDVQIDGHKPPQVVQSANTYIRWKDLPNVHAVAINRGWEFTASLTGAEPDSLGTLIAEYQIDVFNDAFFFGEEMPQMQIADGSWVGVGHLQIDTGSFEDLITKGVATLDGLPNLGPTTIGGIGGMDTAYKTEANIKLGNTIIPNQPFVVDPNYNAMDDGLWGAHTLIASHIAMYLNPTTRVLRYYQAQS